MKKFLCGFSVAALTAGMAQAAAFIGVDDFEDGNRLQDAGAGDSGWITDWTVNGAGSTFLETTTPIEGSNSIGVFGNGGETWINATSIGSSWPCRRW